MNTCNHAHNNGLSIIIIRKYLTHKKVNIKIHRCTAIDPLKRKKQKIKNMTALSNTFVFGYFFRDHTILVTLHSSQRFTAFHTVIYVMLFNLNLNAPIVCCLFVSAPHHTLLRIQNTNCISIQMLKSHMF